MKYVLWMYSSNTQGYKYKKENNEIVLVYCLHTVQNQISTINYNGTIINQV